MLDLKIIRKDQVNYTVKTTYISYKRLGSQATNYPSPDQGPKHFTL